MSDVTLTETEPRTRKPTADEMDAILLLVRGGWLRFELTAIPEQRTSSEMGAVAL